MNHTLEKKPALDEFTETLKSLAGVLDNITRIEEDKARAASQNQHHMMDDFLKEEQVLLLKLRGLEQKRIKLAEELGWKDLTFRQILEAASENQKETLSPLFSSLTEKTAHLEDAKTSAERIIKIRLREFGAALSKDGQQGYDGNGGPMGGPPSHFRDKYV